MTGEGIYSRADAWRAGPYLSGQGMVSERCGNRSPGVGGGRCDTGKVSKMSPWAGRTRRSGGATEMALAVWGGEVGGFGLPSPPRGHSGPPYGRHPLSPRRLHTAPGRPTGAAGLGGLSSCPCPPPPATLATRVPEDRTGQEPQLHCHRPHPEHSRAPPAPVTLHLALPGAGPVDATEAPTGLLPPRITASPEMPSDHPRCCF